MESNADVPRVDESTEERVIVEEQKATWDDTATVVREFTESAPGVASVKCPRCHRQIGFVIGEPYRHVCGALLLAKKAE